MSTHEHRDARQDELLALGLRLLGTVVDVHHVNETDRYSAEKELTRVLHLLAAHPMTPTPTPTITDKLAEALAKLVDRDLSYFDNLVQTGDITRQDIQDGRDVLATYRQHTEAQAATAGETACNEVQPGNAYCDQCANGNYHLCRWTKAGRAAIAAQAVEQAAQPVARIRTWHKDEVQHAQLDDWMDGIDPLPDGEHLLYTHPQRGSEPLTAEQIERLAKRAGFGKNLEGEWMVPFERDAKPHIVKLVRAIEAEHGIRSSSSGGGV